MCCLWYVCSFLGVFLSDLLPGHSNARSGILMVNTDPHTESGSNWLAIHFQSKSHSSYYFDSYGLRPYIPSIQSFIRRNCSVWDYNTVHLQGHTSTICGKCCCLFVLYMGRRYTSKQFVGLLATATADKVVSDMFVLEFWPLRNMSRGGQFSCSKTKT